MSHGLALGLVLGVVTLEWAMVYFMVIYHPSETPYVLELAFTAIYCIGVILTPVSIGLRFLAKCLGINGLVQNAVDNTLFDGSKLRRFIRR